MTAILLLIIILTLLFLAKPRHSRSYHIAVLAIFGIFYFCIWYFLDFYVTVFQWQEKFRYILLGGLFSLAAISAVLPWTRNIGPFPAYCLAILFFISLALTYGFEKNIKHALASLGGYYNKEASYKLPDRIKQEGKKFNFVEGGIEVIVPPDWVKKTHNSGLTYFVYPDDSRPLIEMRPHCFHNSDLTLPEIMSNMKISMAVQYDKIEQECSIAFDNWHTCSLHAEKDRADPKSTVWRWLAVDTEHAQSVEIDFVYSNTEPSLMHDVLKVINSIKVYKLDEPYPGCLSPAEWL